MFFWYFLHFLVNFVCVLSFFAVFCRFLTKKDVFNDFGHFLTFLSNSFFMFFNFVLFLNSPVFVAIL